MADVWPREVLVHSRQHPVPLLDQHESGLPIDARVAFDEPTYSRLRSVKTAWDPDTRSATIPADTAQGRRALTFLGSGPPGSITTTASSKPASA